MSKQLSVKGNVFKGYVEAIIAKHGFGSDKMVGETENRIMINLLRESSDEDCIKIGEAQNWLLDNGFIRKYEASWETNRRHRYSVTGCKDYIGLTAKGWAVANKYLNA